MLASARPAQDDVRAAVPRCFLEKTSRVSLSYLESTCLMMSYEKLNLLTLFLFISCTKREGPGLLESLSSTQVVLH